jgi:tape measure domain-containing protein
MNNVETFVLELKEYLSGGIQRAAVTTHSAFAAMGNDIAQTQRGFDRLNGNVRLNVDSTSLDQAQAKIDSVNSRMNMLGGTMAVAAGSLISKGIEQTMGFARDQIADTLQLGLDASAQMVQFKVLGGAEKGMGLYKELTKYVQDSVFGPELYKDARTMMAFGVAVDNVMPTMKMLGDVAMGDKEKMGALTYAFSQTTSAGKLMGQDLIQYTSAGFNPLMVIAEKTHGLKTVQQRFAELRDKMSEGKISADMVRQSFVWATEEGGKFHGMLENMANTPYGMKQAMEGSIQGAKMGLGTALMPDVTDFMNELNPVVYDLPRTLEQIRPAIHDVLTDFVDMVKWTEANTEGLGKMFGVMKVGVEAYVAWRVATTAMTVANWAWSAVATTVTTQTGLMITEEQLLTKELLEQTDVLAGNQLAWLAMSKAELAALDAAAANTATIGMTQVAGSAAGSAAGSLSFGAVASGIMGGAARAAVPVTIAYFTTEAVAQLLDKNPFTGKGWDAMSMTHAAANFGAGENVALGLSMLSTLGIDPIKNALDAQYRDAQSKLQPMLHIADVANNNWGAGAKNPFFPGLTMAQHQDDAAAKADDASKAMAEVSDAIVNGGSKQVIINLNQPLIGKQEYHVGSRQEAEEVSLRTSEENLFKILESAAAASFSK